MRKLQGKVAVITGGNSGIGLATAHLFAQQGARVAILGRNPETLNAAVKSLEGKAIGVQGDVSNLADIDKLFTKTNEVYGKVDILFVNAGIAPMAPLEQTTPEFFSKVFDINVKGAYFTVQKALPYLNDNASIVLTGSVVTEVGMPGASTYSASKAALRSLARTFSAELIGRGIRVNNLSPGPIETPIFGRMGLPPEAMEEMSNAIISQVPIGRIGKADEIARAALFLASEDSSFVVGIDLAVDGGMTRL